MLVSCTTGREVNCPRVISQDPLKIIILAGGLKGGIRTVTVTAYLFWLVPGTCKTTTLLYRLGFHKEFVQGPTADGPEGPGRSAPGEAYRVQTPGGPCDFVW